ncbi:MAG: polysaccharide biosynthesis protein [Erysipelothrix sp.]|nr:polysaccharide biosynthesis protein [Erysipelothrix sp.]
MNKEFIKMYFEPLYDLSIVGLSYILGYWIRYDFSVQMLRDSTHITPMGYASVFVIHAFFYFSLRIHQTVWSKTSLSEYMRIVIMNLLSGGMLINFRLLGILKDQSMGALMIMMLLNMIFMFISRGMYRYMRLLNMRKSRKHSGKQILIYGAGSSGRMILTEILENVDYDYHVVGFMDDNVALHKTRIFSTTVYGGIDELDFVFDKYDIDEVIVAMPSQSRDTVQPILNALTKYKVTINKVSSSKLLIESSNFRQSLRSINVLDLLGRKEIVIDDIEIQNTIKDKVVMITGAGGSIGSELVRQIVTREPKFLILIDVNETGIYAIQQEIRIQMQQGIIPMVDGISLIKSIREKDALEAVFKEYKPELVFHAAAHKHVPLMESVPEEALKNNILGTFNLIKLSDKYNVQKFVNISTDKAVNPTNVMGATKRFNEMMLQTLNKSSKTKFVAVRFGNVLGPNGSVVPLFKKQIQSGGPLTVTHPDIARYFMTIPEAVSLVLQSAVYAKGGEIFVLDMGKPVKILDMAEKIIELSGLKPYEDIDIQFVGLRPGEKLYEELLMDEEGMTKTPNDLIFVTKPMDFTEAFIYESISKINRAIEESNTDYIALLKELVSTYKEA